MLQGQSVIVQEVKHYRVEVVCNRTVLKNKRIFPLPVMWLYVLTCGEKKNYQRVELSRGRLVGRQIIEAHKSCKHS